MSAGEWIALAALILTAMGSICGFIYWAAHRDAKAQQSIEATGELKAAVLGLTTALQGMTSQLREFQAEMRSWKEHVEDTHEAIWEEIGKLRDRG